MSFQTDPDRFGQTRKPAADKPAGKARDATHAPCKPAARCFE
ncbi:hypothetical protein BCF33_1620 [Hasllibacter halocynthiae]|uniref:Uncharacterized protein n=1 Tax=Hasllibacter halocynthiae TaxID=595589 RepID=A0A2T0X1E3_9RHOB|nr:hypothetical protein [Hasllibacter halocynthiae]PRY92766.1 hypothetical protein BCF33_1620 [Hasllibacter halocynthiae]